MRIEAYRFSNETVTFGASYCGPPRGDIEAVARVTREGDALVLRNLDIGGPGPGALGRDAVGELRGLVRELGRQESVEYVRVEPWIRRTGAGRGRMTRPIVIEVDT